MTEHRNTNPEGECSNRFGRTRLDAPLPQLAEGVCFRSRRSPWVLPASHGRVAYQIRLNNIDYSAESVGNSCYVFSGSGSVCLTCAPKLMKTLHGVYKTRIRTNSDKVAQSGRAIDYESMCCGFDSRPKVTSLSRCEMVKA